MGTSAVLRACEKIPPWLRMPLSVPGRVAGPPILGHVELGYTPRYWDSRALPDTPRSTLASRGDYFTNSERLLIV